MRGCEWQEDLNVKQIKTVVINTPYYLKLCFLENWFDEYLENSDIKITMVMVIIKMLKSIMKVDWTRNLSRWMHFLVFYRLEKNKAQRLSQIFRVGHEGSGMPIYMKIKIVILKISLEFMQNITIRKNKESFISTRGPILASKYQLYSI